MLANWTIGGSYAGNYASIGNTLWLTMDDDYTVAATFVPAFTVNVCALQGVDIYVADSIPVSYTLYIDGIDSSFYVVDGYVTLPLGVHMFYVDLPCYYDYDDQNYYYFDSFIQLTGQNYPFTATGYAANPALVDIEENCNLIIWYV